jgi:hypothetical protein
MFENPGTKLTIQNTHKQKYIPPGSPRGLLADAAHKQVLLKRPARNLFTALETKKSSSICIWSAVTRTREFWSHGGQGQTTLRMLTSAAIAAGCFLRRAVVRAWCNTWQHHTNNWLFVRILLRKADDGGFCDGAICCNAQAMTYCSM